MTVTETHAEHQHDTPRNAMGLLERRVTIGTVVVLLALAAAAWWSTLGQARDMSAMVTGLGQVGDRMPNDMGALIFLGMWVVMMVAMMFPTIAPMVLVHRLVVRKRNEGIVPTIAFVGGYLLVWSAIGLIPMAGFLGFRELSGSSADSRWLPTLGGGILIVAGLYQFTPWKGLCLRACRSPVSFMMTHDWKSGSRGAFRAGLSHGAYCLGCCWALMAVLVVVGLMNLVWMAGIALVFLAEKNWKHGVALTKVAGFAIAVLGIAAVISPGILRTVSDVGPRDGGSMQMEDPGSTTGDGMEEGGSMERDGP